MSTVNRASKILGAAFLVQFITSIVSGTVLRPLWLVPDNMAETLSGIADNPFPIRAAILLDMLTSLGVIFLGAVLFVTLRRLNEKLALTALGFYILEGALLAASRMATFSLVGLGQEYVASDQPAAVLRLANLAFDSMEFVGSTLHILAFCLGAIIFYFLLHRSGLVPRGLSLWGLIAVLPLLVGSVAEILGYSLPFALYVPYVPFELVVGIWILATGSRGVPQAPAQSSRV